MHLIPLAVVAASVAPALAYPYMAEFAKAQKDGKRAIIPFPKIGGIPRIPGSVPFDAKSQYVDLTGEHEWRAPGPDDVRGPCAGLNAAANHGFIPRDGIATYDTIQTGLWEAFGLDQTATQVLQQTTALFDGDPISQRWSIGGYSPKTAALGGVLSILGQESGIGAYGHAKSENDASITRGDFLANSMNSNCESYAQFFQELLDESKRINPDGRITMDSLASHQNNRKLYSRSTNPNYFAPVFAGVAFTPAAHHFANNSAEYPEGYLSPENLMSWFSYTRDGSGNLVQKFGYERIPAPFYKRAISNPWTLTDILTGVAQQCLAYPDTCEIGGNTGTVNSFAGVQVGDLSGGLFGAEALTDPAKLGCFLSQNIQAEAPSFLSNVLQGSALQSVLDALVPTLAKGFGDCNGINVLGGNAPRGKPAKSWATKYPGANPKYDPARAKCPSP